MNSLAINKVMKTGEHINHLSKIKVFFAIIALRRGEINYEYKIVGSRCGPTILLMCAILYFF